MSFAETVVLGDVEGQWHRLESFFEESQAFEKVGDQWHLKEGYDFVFMGDATDRGESSLQILKTLIQIKEQAPRRVHYILGNRDINKLRLLSELSPHGLQEPPNERVSRESFEVWLREFQDLNQGDLSKFDLKELRLRWIFESTMHAPQAFAFRQIELAKENSLKARNEDVVNSFVSDLDPRTGLMAKYLQLAQLAYVDKENRTLFVHGGLSIQAVGKIPNKKKNIKNFHSWLHQLNDWAQIEIKKSLRMPNYKSPLILYQEPIPGTNTNPNSIVYHRNFDLSGNPIMIPESLQDLLLDHGIDTLVVGHTPVGKTPFIIANKKFRIVYADTSASTELRSSPIRLESGKVRIESKIYTSGNIDPIFILHQFSKETLTGLLVAQGRILSVINDQALTMKIHRENGYTVEYRWLDLRKNRLCYTTFAN